jgi:hypothetical protein
MVRDTLGRYLIASDYLNSHRLELNKQWIELFKGKNKRYYKSELGNEFNFKVSSVICFLPILIFKDEIFNLDTITHHTKPEIEEPSIYNGKYLFNSFVSEYLLDVKIADTIKEISPHTFVVTFSKPINNYLMAEITMNPKRLSLGDPKILGRTMWMIFVFSTNESLNKVYYSYYDR